MTPHPPTTCLHCGDPVTPGRHESASDRFCCTGCRAVHQLLQECGLGDYYSLGAQPGIRGPSQDATPRFSFLDDPAVRDRVVDYSDERITRVRFRIPSIHCVACIWLLEHLHRILPAIGVCRVQFPRKEASIEFSTSELKLGELAALLTRLGYEPDLNLGDLSPSRVSSAHRRLWLQLGIAGFAFGNTMLFSAAHYLGLDAFDGPGFSHLAGRVSLVLSLPVVTYCAMDYWKAAWVGLKHGVLNLEVPIAAGILALFLQSSHDVLLRGGEGYFDSLAGLLFFLLCGRLFQRVSHDRLSFQRTYESFLPMSATRVRRTAAAGSSDEESVALSQLKVGDVIRVRSGQLVPCDARIVQGQGHLDYSFVTGEAAPMGVGPGDLVHAGARQVGGAIEIQVGKPVSDSYLASLWNQEVFRKPRDDSRYSIIQGYSRRFTLAVLLIALLAAGFWLLRDPAVALKAFVSVLIVACPCALALASPFTLGTAHRCLARQGIFLRSPEVLESLSQVNTILFDKTGTLTCGSSDAVEWMGAPLSGEERHRVALLASQSHHPMAASVSGSLACTPPSGPVLDFQEHAGRGMDGRVEGHSIRMGSSEYVRGSEPLSAPEPPTAGASPACGPQVPCSVVRPWTVLPGPDAPARRTLQGEPEPSTVHLSIDDAYRGRFELRLPLRPLAPEVVAALSPQYSVGLISGDTERDRDRFQELFHDSSLVQFRRNPTDKLEFVGRLQSEGRHVMMVGDGLNDAGALKQGDVGVALLEDLSGFSPASDVILSADSLACLPGMMRYARSSARIIRHALLLSGLYNAIGIAIASAGLLAPWVCAVLMPLSSVSVVLFATGAASWAASRQLHPTPSHGTIPPVNRRRGSVGWLMPQGGESQA